MTIYKIITKIAVIELRIQAEPYLQDDHDLLTELSMLYTELNNFALALPHQFEFERR
jgi:hypothetical protein